MKPRCSFALALALAALGAACASSKLDLSTTAPSPDRRVGLRAGWMNAGEAAWNLRLVSTTQPSAEFIDLKDPNDFEYINSDLAFLGNRVIEGNFHGFQVWDISQPDHPTLVTAFVCPGAQNDVSVYRNLLFVSGEAPNGRGGTGAPTGADSATLRANAQTIVDRIVEGPPRVGPRPGPTQCHDITVYPAIGLAGGACAGYGLLLDIRDVTNPRRINAVADSNFAFWHSATFSNDGSKILFTDEWGGGLQARCRVTDRREWGADALFTRQDSTLTFRSYYKLPAPQTANENCVAHNGSLIPVPGRDIMVQGWYQGGISVFDWTDPAHPKEIAYFDRGPMDSTRLVGAGSWSAYWYNGYIVSSEIARGLDVFELQPSGLLSQNEIDAAKLVHVDYLNAQDQQKLVWPPSFVVARAYLDQLARSNGLPPARVAAVRSELARAEKLSGQARRDALTQLATQLNGDAPRGGTEPVVVVNGVPTGGGNGSDQVRALAATVTDLANGTH